MSRFTHLLRSSTESFAAPISGFCTIRAVPLRRTFAALLKEALVARRSDLAVRKNYPYLGKTDGLTTTLRKKWEDALYLGIEIEVNQRWALGDRRAWRRLQADVADSLAEAVTHLPRGRVGS